MNVIRLLCSLKPVTVHIPKHSLCNKVLRTIHILCKYSICLDEADKSAAYCLKTLRRQLEMETYRPAEWALNCACLSQFFITRNMFAEGKHCLACANFIIGEVQDEEDDGRQAAFGIVIFDLLVL